MGLATLGQQFFLLACLIPAFSTAEIQSDPNTPVTSGLLWNHSGLPAVFPLQVKTPVGQNYFLTLVDKGTGKEALAAYIVGGAFFKVLVPPGTYKLRFSFGDVWQGEERLFGLGSKTGKFELEEPLTFKIHGASIKGGHLVDITEIQQGQLVRAAVKGQFICQTLRTKFYPSLNARYAQEFAFQNVAENNISPPFVGKFRMLGDGPYLRPENRYFFHLEFEVRSRYCE